MSVDKKNLVLNSLYSQQPLLKRVAELKHIQQIEMLSALLGRGKGMSL